MTQSAVVVPAPSRSSSRHVVDDQVILPLGVRERLRAFLTLARVRVVALVLFSMIMASWIAGTSMPDWAALGHLVLGTALVTLGAVVLNQRLEVRRDAVMLRTADRPMPAGLLALSQGTWLGMTTTLLGILYLAMFLSSTFAILAALTWFLYAVVYTLLKPVTAWQTPVGAISGAMPMLLGTAMASPHLTGMGWMLFGIVYFWQFPHAMAIAWLYRRQYRRAGIRVAPVVDPSGRSSGWIAALGGIALIVVSVLPSVLQMRDWTYGAVAFVLGLVYLRSAFRFSRSRDERTARQLFRVSLAYLPLVLLALFVATLHVR